MNTKPDPIPLEEARQRAVDVFRDPDSDETDATNALMVLEAQAQAEAVEPYIEWCATLEAALKVELIRGSFLLPHRRALGTSEGDERA